MKQFIVLVFCLVAAESEAVRAQGVLDLGVTAEPVAENYHGSWVNLRLRLVFDWTSTDTCYLRAKDEPCDLFLPYFDHLVLENLDEGGGTAIPRFNVLEYPGDDDDVLGSWNFTQTRLECVPDTVHPDSCSRSVWLSHLHGEATLVTNIPACGHWRLHYVADAEDWWLFCGFSQNPEDGVPAERTFLIPTGRFAQWTCEGVDTNLVAYVENTPPPELIRTWADIDFGNCPEPPPIPGQTIAKFRKYLKPDGSDGKNWLPSPHDSIGLVFDVTTDPPGLEYEMAYHVWDISMWQGECMNSPRYDSSTALGQVDKEPAVTGFQGRVHTDSVSMEHLLPFWDFTVGRPDSFTLYVNDRQTLIGGWPRNLGFVPGDTVRYHYEHRLEFPESRPLFQSEVIAWHRSKALHDTLWLRSHDYAAHCLVTPEVGGGKDRRMLAYQIPYVYNRQNLYTITVPFDYDGYSGEGYNFGDGMNDEWERGVFSVVNPYPIRPFVTVGGRRGPVDFDHVPVGRGFDGDNWCNFAEYRGSIVRTDSTYHNPGSRHQRQDPLRKTVQVHVRSNMGLDNDNRMVLQQMPGDIYKLQLPSIEYSDTVEIYFTDSIRFFPVKTSPTDAAIESRRFYGWSYQPQFVSDRDVNFNRHGAGLWHYAFGAPTTDPMAGEGTTRAVTIWAWDAVPEVAMFRQLGVDPEHTLIFGHILRPRPVTDFATPNETYRIVIGIPYFLLVGDLRYDHRRDLAWPGDFSRECKMVIAHEFGHSVGMMHFEHEFCLPTTITIMNRVCFDPLTSHFMIPSSSFFANDSKAEFTIRRNSR